MSYCKRCTATKRIVLLLVLCFAFLPFDSRGDEKTGDVDWIMSRVYQKKRAETMASTTEMILVDEDNVQRKRKIQSFTKQFEEGTKRVIFFLEPADVRGTGFLSFDHSDAAIEDEQWIYLPALHKTKRISGANRRGSFMGSDFSYADMTQKNKEDYTYTLLKEADSDGHRVWVIQSVPANNEVLERDGYSKSLLLVRQDNFVVVKMVHWLRNSNTLKYYETETLEFINGYWVPKVVKAKTVNNGKTLHQTILVNSSLSVDEPMTDDIFTFRRLEQGF